MFPIGSVRLHLMCILVGLETEKDQDIVQEQEARQGRHDQKGRIEERKTNDLSIKKTDLSRSTRKK
jgi:hypothetical protein